MGRLKSGLAGRYTIEHEVGRSGMAIAFLASDQKHDRNVAIKVLKPEIAAAIDSERFLREIEIAARLQHPLILPLFDSGQAVVPPLRSAEGGKGVEAFLYYVMPFVEGESLRERLLRETQLSLEDTFHIAGDVAKALSHAHSRGVVHRDIKPENIHLSAEHAVLTDFGIAQAVAVAGGESLTSSDVAIGTPAYMSPEQASGAGEIDGRSDLYSLGCVVYEMLAGEPPFTGSTTEAVIARQIQEEPQSLRIIRATVPVHAERVVEKTLAKVPADRYRTAEKFAEAISSLGTEPAGVRRTIKETLLVHRRWMMVALAAIAGLFLVTKFVVPLIFPPGLGASTYVVAAFADEGGPDPLLLDGDDGELWFSRALSSFVGVRPANPLLVDERRNMVEGDAVQLSDWYEIARAVRAGRLATVDIGQRGDTVYLNAVLYAISSRGRPDQLNTASIDVVVGADDLAEKFESLVAALLDVPTRPGGEPMTRDLRASRAFVEGREALRRWSLSEAEQKLREATVLDPQFADAHLSLAHSMMWAGRPVDDWQTAARQATWLSGRLEPNNRLLARALLALAEGQFPQSCTTYRDIIARDSSAVEAWIGLGDCNRMDGIVVRDPASPSRWRFRSSYHTAVRAYTQVLRLVPSSNRVFAQRGIQPLLRVLFVETKQLRAGVAAPPDTGSFRAYPSLQGDTLAFVPYPTGDVYAARPGTISPTRDDALVRNQSLFLQLAEQWSSAVPRSAAAHETHAFALELLGHIDSSMTAIERAREVARDSAEEMSAAVRHVRLLLKSDRFAWARALSDSLIERWSDPNPDQAHALEALAALTGHVHQTVQLVLTALPAHRRSLQDDRLRALPAPVIGARERLLAYAAFGEPVDSVRALEREVVIQLRTWVEGLPEQDVLHALLDQPMQLAFPFVGGSTVHRPRAFPGGDLIEIQWALSQRDTAAVRTRLDTLVQMRRAQRTRVSPWRLYQEVWLLLQVGDTATAGELLGRSFNRTALPTLSSRVIESPDDAVGLVRGMALRAELAAQVGDTAAAHAWARRVIALWSDASDELQPVLDRMMTMMRKLN